MILLTDKQFIYSLLIFYRRRFGLLLVWLLPGIYLQRQQTEKSKSWYLFPLIRGHSYVRKVILLTILYRNHALNIVFIYNCIKFHLALSVFFVCSCNGKIKAYETQFLQKLRLFSADFSFLQKTFYEWWKKR